jgi:hypothetical protein
LSDVVARGCLYGYHVAYFQWQIGRVDIEAFAGVFKLHLHHVVVGISTGYILKVVEAVKFAAYLASVAAAAAATFAAHHCVGIVIGVGIGIGALGTCGADAIFALIGAIGASAAATAFATAWRGYGLCGFQIGLCAFHLFLFVHKLSFMLW